MNIKRRIQRLESARLSWNAIPRIRAVPEGHPEEPRDRLMTPGEWAARYCDESEGGTA